MNRRITERQLRVDSDHILRALEKGASFTITRRGIAVGELVPLRPRIFVPAESVAAAFHLAPPISRAKWRHDIDTAI